jgi:hypothetical protein
VSDCFLWVFFFFLFFFFFWWYWGLNSGPHACYRQAVYHLSHSASPFLY